MTEIEIRLSLKLRVPENDLNVNGVLQGIEEQTPVVLSTILETILKALEERAITKLKKQDPGRYVSNGHQRNARKLITHFGPFHYRMAQMIDTQTGKTVAPLARELALLPYRQYQAEALEAGVGLAIHLSYAQASNEIQRIRGSGPSKSTTYRWFREISRTQGVWPEMKEIPYRFLMVDGMKVRFQGPGGMDLGQKEMRWALASLGPRSKFKPVGFWIDKSWAYIRRDLERRLTYDKLEVLFSDGGAGIEENLLAEGMRPQRCLWHGKRDFPFILYADGIKKAEQEPLRSLFAKIPIFYLSKAQLEQIDPADIEMIHDKVENTRKGFEDLLEALDPDKYPKSRTYIANLSRRTMTFLDYWLETQHWLPLNINAIESAFSRVANRIKNIGRRWSDQGLLAWLMLALRKIFTPELWDELWDQYLNINRRLELILCHAEYRWLQ